MSTYYVRQPYIYVNSEYFPFYRYPNLYSLPPSSMSLFLPEKRGKMLRKKCSEKMLEKNILYLTWEEGKELHRFVWCPNSLSLGSRLPSKQNIYKCTYFFLYKNADTEPNPGQYKGPWLERLMSFIKWPNLLCLTGLWKSKQT